MHETSPDAPDATDAPEPQTDRGWVANLRWGSRVSVLAALAMALVLELSTLVTSSPKFWWSFFSSLSFVLDSLIVWMVLVALIALTNRVVLSIGLLGAFVGLVAIANRIKINIRSEPIYPSDIDFVGEPGFLTTMVSTSFLVVVGVVLVTVLVAVVVLARKRERRLLPVWPRHLAVKWRVLALGVRAAVLAMVVGLLVSTHGFNDPGNPWKKAYELGAANWRPYNQRTNYAAHGFLGGFLYNMPTVAMPVPKGYSRATMQSLADKYAARAAATNASRTGTLEDTNVVIVLSESFSDPTRLKGFTLQQDPIPRTRALMKRTTSGTMLAQLLGGGTANMEFEVLTGQSIGLFAPQLSSPYQMLVSGYRHYPSAVGWFASQGYRPIAIHPYMPGMYKRQTVYRTFGFDDFIHDTGMSSEEKIDDSDFISDASAFEEVRRQIARSDEPLLVNLVTMQNHIPVDGVYRDPIGVEGLSGDEADRVGQFARGLAHTDEALAAFLADLERSEEKTVVIFYGDHLPGIYPGSVKDANPGDALYETPFFIWSNRGTPAQQLPVTSPTHFLPLLYAAADAPIPPYFALLDALRDVAPALEQGRVVQSDGADVRLSDLSPAQRQVVEDARMVQYDFSIGRRYAISSMWPGSVR